jgi:type I restriction enzyme S subunit
MSYQTQWPLVPLEELLNGPLLNGPHQKGMEYGLGTKIVRMVDLYRGDVIDEGTLDRVIYPNKPSAEYLLANSDILVNRTSLKREGVAKASLITNFVEAAYFDCSIIRVRIDTKKADPKYMLYALNGPAVRPQIRRGAKTATITTISQPDIQQLNIPLPPIKEQCRIVAILDKADAIRSKRQQAIQFTEEFLRSVFLDMFGDPVTNPKRWIIDKLGDHLIFVTSGSRGWAKYYSSSGVKFIRSLDVRMNYLSHEDVAYVNPPKSAESERTRVKSGDVVLTITGSKIGRVAPIPEDIGEAYISQHVAILRLDEGIRPRFVSAFLSDPKGGQHQIRQMQYGQTKPGLNLDQIRNFDIPCPPLSLQNKFINVWDRYDNHVRNQKVAEATYEDCFNALVQCAFRGEL